MIQGDKLHQFPFSNIIFVCLFLCLSFFLHLFCLSLTHILSVTVCPKGWVSFRGGCYLIKFESTKLSWDDASNWCLANRAALASINDPEINNFFSNYFKGLRLTSQKSLWIGWRTERRRGPRAFLRSTVTGSVVGFQRRHHGNETSGTCSPGASRSVCGVPTRATFGAGAQAANKTATFVKGHPQNCRL